MKLYNRHLAQLDSRVRGNDGKAIATNQIIPASNITSTSNAIQLNSVIPESHYHVIPESHHLVIPAKAGIHNGYGAITEQLAVVYLISQGIRPESLPPAEDVKKVERRLATAEKKVLKNPESLEGSEWEPENIGVGGV